jgi:hypothetical protein
MNQKKAAGGGYYTQASDFSLSSREPVGSVLLPLPGMQTVSTSTLPGFRSWTWRDRTGGDPSAENSNRLQPLSEPSRVGTWVETS